MKPSPLSACFSFLILLSSLYRCRQPQEPLGESIDLVDPDASNLPGLLARLHDATVRPIKLRHGSMRGFAQRLQLLVIGILLIELRDSADFKRAAVDITRSK